MTSSPPARRLSPSSFSWGEPMLGVLRPARLVARRESVLLSWPSGKSPRAEESCIGEVASGAFLAALPANWCSKSCTFADSRLSCRRSCCEDRCKLSARKCSRSRSALASSACFCSWSAAFLALLSFSCSRAFSQWASSRSCCNCITMLVASSARDALAEAGASPRADVGGGPPTVSRGERAVPKEALPAPWPLRLVARTRSWVPRVIVFEAVLLRLASFLGALPACGACPLAPRTFGDSARCAISCGGPRGVTFSDRRGVV
mmetsp:Transcript_39468/g.102145  ORF Transcript_39468/g.102145 Transcript_39468/m.102145 type:complete len:262 (-) Transcript_39468:684-1469(-)